MYNRTVSFIAFYWACLVVLTNAMAIEPKYKTAAKRQLTYSREVKEDCAQCMRCMTTVADWPTQLKSKCMSGSEGYCHETRCPLSAFDNFNQFTELSASWMSHYFAHEPEGVMSPLALTVQMFAEYQYEYFSGKLSDEEANISEVLKQMGVGA